MLTAVTKESYSGYINTRKIYFKTQNISRYKRRYFLMIKGLTHQEVIIISKHVPKNTCPKCETRADWTEVGNRKFNNHIQKIQHPAFKIV